MRNIGPKESRKRLAFGMGAFVITLFLLVIMMALDLSLPATAIAPVAEAPPVPGVADAQLLVYLGGG